MPWDWNTCVVLDTNQWDRFPMLRHKVAAPFFLLLKRHDAFIGVPEVIKEEAALHLVEKHDSAQQDAQRAIGQIRQILGRARDLELHKEAVVRAAFDARMSELGELLEVVPMTDEDMLAAGRMVLDATPPNSRGSQQYKDSLIWRAILRLATEYEEVIFVTQDGGFYEGKSNELATSLRRDVDNIGASVAVFRRLEDLLDHWRAGGPPIDAAPLIRIVEETVREKLIEELEKRDTRLTANDRSSAEADVYVTEVHDEVVLLGRFEYQLAAPDDENHEVVGVARVEASATLNVDGPVLLELSLERMNADMYTPHGDANLATVVYGRGALVVGGPPMRPYDLRERLDLQ